MKKIILLTLLLFSIVASKAQWTNDPVHNNFIASTSYDAGEIYLVTNATTGDTYVQWMQFFPNNWSPTIQRLTFDGQRPWGDSGIHIDGHQFSSSSEGIALATTTDGAAVSCFANYDGYTYAVKINADGSFPWGDRGVLLFDGQGFSRTQLVAGNDGGVWALGSTYNQLFVQYINADGTLNPTNTISDSQKSVMFGQVTLGNDNKVFVTYEKLGSGFFTDKQIFVAGYNVDGTPFSPETLLMSTQTFQSTYIHSAISDGMGGGYVYIWHSGIESAFNVYVFHFDENGVPTIDATGTPVHSNDPENLYISAYATVDPLSHDLIIAYEQTDSETQYECKLYMNRITSNGERLWGEGKLILDNGTIPCGGIRVDAFEYGNGFSVIFHKGISITGGSQSTVEAIGYNDKGVSIWETQLCSSTYNKTGDECSTGFHGGQNIVAWVNCVNGGMYGQNVGQNGEMGEVSPVLPCPAPTNLRGEYVYNDEMCGTMISWDAPEASPTGYRIYGEDLSVYTEVDAESTSYFAETLPGTYTYRVTAVYDDCESDFALTESGVSYLEITVTATPEFTDSEMVTIVKVYTMSGQLLRDVNPETLSQGIYLIQGLTKEGNLVTRKKVVNSKL